MPVEFIGMISTKEQSETRLSGGPVIDRAYTRRFARAHEDAGFDRVLIGYASSQPDGAQVAAYAAAHTERLSFLVAHRPGFVAPTLAARQFATLDQFTGGRIAVHVITGGNDAEQRRDGDYLSKDERYARTDEYLDILKQAWTAEAPFSYQGQHYKLEDFYSGVKSPQQPRIRLYFGGSSEEAYRVGGKHADTFALWGEPLAETKQQIDSVSEAARKAGRAHAPGISVSFRPILGPTEELAWERAHRILRVTKENLEDFTKRRRRQTWGLGGAHPENRGSQRLLAAAARSERHDRALWTPLAGATGAAGNSTALVGTPETVAQALLDYVDIGATTLLIRGYDPYDDAIDYGRYLLPLVREEVAKRDAEKAAATAAGLSPQLPGLLDTPPNGHDVVLPAGHVGFVGFGHLGCSWRGARYVTIE
jgi:alkanesulfonate monooxygenase